MKYKITDLAMFAEQDKKYKDALKEREEFIKTIPYQCGGRSYATENDEVLERFWHIMELDDKIADAKNSRDKYLIKEM